MKILYVTTVSGTNQCIFGSAHTHVAGCGAFGGYGMQRELSDKRDFVGP